MADGLPGHGASFAAIQEIIEGGPIHSAGLRLHHPKILALEASRQVMREAIAVGIYVASANIVVPRGKGERFGDRVVIESVEEAHEVAGRKLARVRVFADGVDLVLLI